MAASAASWLILARPKLVCSTMPVPLITGRRFMRLFSSAISSARAAAASAESSGVSPAKIRLRSRSAACRAAWVIAAFLPWATA